MDHPTQHYTSEYEAFRKSRRLKQGTWRQDDSQGKTYACALGAFLGARSQSHADRLGCVASMMPAWLVDVTPAMFDENYSERTYHLKWADALYMPGGLVDRANRLPKRQRVALYKKAKKEILRRYICHSEDGNIAWCQVDADEDITEAFESFKSGAPRMQAAGTIIHVLDELLKEAGV
jgi:hypothetical protein